MPGDAGSVGCYSASADGRRRVNMQRGGACGCAPGQDGGGRARLARRLGGAVRHCGVSKRAPRARACHRGRSGVMPRRASWHSAEVRSGIRRSYSEFALLRPVGSSSRLALAVRTGSSFYAGDVRPVAWTMECCLYESLKAKLAKLCGSPTCTAQHGYTGTLPTS